MTSVKKVSPETLKGWLQGPNPPALVDVENYQRRGHLKGSINLPETKFSAYLPWLREQIHDKRRVVFYGSYMGEGPLCARYFAKYNADDKHDIYVLYEKSWDYDKIFGSKFFTEDRYPSLFK